MKLLLMGKIAVGKSATGNTILGHKCFKGYNKTSAGTKDVECSSGRFEDFVVYVVDTPGLMDAETKEEERVERAGADMVKALDLCGGEFDAFVLVINYANRFTGEDSAMLDILKIIFGENYFKHVILVLTHGDSFHADMEDNRTPEKSFDTWRDEQRGPLRQLFNACDWRIVLFNNREKDEVKIRTQRRQLIQLVRDVHRNNGEYTREIFQEATKLSDRFLKCGKETSEMNLLLMGKTGAGKSASGNTILGRKCFEEYNTMAAGTKRVHFNTGRFDDIAVYVVDPPGLMDAEIKEEERAERAGADMMEALIWCGGEIDAFVLVVSFDGRFAEDERNTLEILKFLFGRNYFNHLIVVLTRGDIFTADMKHKGTPNKSFDTWCDEQTGPFKQLITDCKGRFVLFNNREKDKEEMQKQRKKLVQLVKDIKKNNNGKYTSETFKDAEELREQFIFDQKAPLLQKNILEKLALLIADIERHTITPHQRGLEYIKQGIEDLQNELQTVGKDIKDYQHLMRTAAHLRESLNNTEELYRLAQELHAAQISEMERVAKLTRGAYTTFVLAATLVGAPFAAAFGAGTVLYAFVLKIHNNLRFKRTCTKIAEVTEKIAQSKTKNRQI